MNRILFIIILSLVVIGVNIYMMTGMDYVNWREAGCYACKELEQPPIGRPRLTLKELPS